MKIKNSLVERLHTKRSMVLTRNSQTEMSKIWNTITSKILESTPASRVSPKELRYKALGMKFPSKLIQRILKSDSLNDRVRVSNANESILDKEMLSIPYIIPPVVSYQK